MRLASLFALFFLASPVWSQTFDEKFEHWPIDLKINGRVVVAEQIDNLAPVLEAIGKTTLSGKTLILGDRDVKLKLVTRLQEAFESQGNREIVVSVMGNDVPGPDESESHSDFEGFDLIVCCHTAKGVSGLISRSDQLQEFIGQGKTVVLLNEAAKWAGTFGWAKHDEIPSEGLGLLPDCILMSAYQSEELDKNRLLSALALKPRSVGIGLESDTVLILAGRKILVTGDGQAKFVLMANDRSPIRSHSIRAGRARNPEEVLLDLTQWRRDAIDRTLPVFPPAEPPKPMVENGTLVIVGGGGMPSGLMDRFVELAGGVDKAHLLYVPCAETDSVAETQRTVESWRRMGVKHAAFIHTKDRVRANEDDAFMEPLRDATGIWFGGGRQWNFADSYYGTKTHKLMKGVLKRGGVVGGSSAGASIQARYLARATPIQNFRIMAFGYERGGLGFIGGVAIDQHFSQRGRQRDMTRLVDRYPQVLGIGIDEATALIVQKSVGEVVGRGRVHFYDRNLPVIPGEPDYVALPAGASYDLAVRKVLSDGSKDESHDEDSESEAE